MKSQNLSDNILHNMKTIKDENRRGSDVNALLVFTVICVILISLFGIIVSHPFNKEPITQRNTLQSELPNEPTPVLMKESKDIPDYEALQNLPPTFEIVSFTRLHIAFCKYIPIVVVKDKDTDLEYIMTADIDYTHWTINPRRGYTNK